MKYKLKRSTIVLFLLLILIIFFVWQNNHIVLSGYEYRNRRIPEEFNDYRIIQISDLHNKDFKGRLVEKVRSNNPDIIVITGDLIDRRNTNINVAMQLIQELESIAPIYYVSGNHEQLSGVYDQLVEQLEGSNVLVIDHQYVELERKGKKIGLLGIADPAIGLGEGNYLRADSSQYIEKSIKEILTPKWTTFNILLSHRPEYFKLYRDLDVDLVFSGHAHGGQIRLPFLGGLIAPHQGFLPKYTEGIYRDGRTSMVVSRGLGNSIFPLRVFNRPELIVVTLRSTVP